MYTSIFPITIDFLKNPQIYITSLSFLKYWKEKRYHDDKCHPEAMNIEFKRRIPNLQSSGLRNVESRLLNPQLWIHKLYSLSVAFPSPRASAAGVFSDCHFRLALTRSSLCARGSDESWRAVSQSSGLTNRRASSWTRLAEGEGRRRGGGRYWAGVAEELNYHQMGARHCIVELQSLMNCRSNWRSKLDFSCYTFARRFGIAGSASERGSEGQ